MDENELIYMEIKDLLNKITALEKRDGTLDEITQNFKVSKGFEMLQGKMAMIVVVEKMEEGVQTSVASFGNLTIAQMVALIQKLGAVKREFEKKLVEILDIQEKRGR